MKKGIYKEDLYHLINTIETFNEKLIENAKDGYLRGNKSAMRRARVISVSLEKMFKKLRKQSIKDEKRSKENK